MKKIMMWVGVMAAMLSGCQQEHKQATTDMAVMAENDSVAVLCQVVDSAKDEYDVPEVAIWIKNKTSGDKTKLYQTVRPDWHAWYMGDGNKFRSVSIDSILVTDLVTIYNNDPLQLIVEGCPDMRNEVSYFIDVPSRKAWYVPANAGYVGSTAVEHCMIFQSYRYVSDPDIAGRYTYLQIFDNKGVMVDSLNMEHVHLQLNR